MTDVRKKISELSEASSLDGFMAVGYKTEDGVNTSYKADLSVIGDASELETTADNLVEAVNEVKDIADEKYIKPASGIPASDMASAVQTSLGKADSALQSVPNTYRTSAAQDVIDAAKQDILQYSTMPTASASLVGKIYQYVGTTTVSLTNGHFYKCAESGGSYSWVEVTLGGGGGTSDYSELTNKPQIAGVTLSGNKSLADLGIQASLTFDDAPAQGSNNPVKSGGIYTALAAKQAALVSGTNIKTINGESVLGADDIDTHNVFIARYGSTSYADIKEAYENGKVILVKNVDAYGLLYRVIGSATPPTFDYDFSFIAFPFGRPIAMYIGYRTSWSNRSLVDNAPTADSLNYVLSGAIYTALQAKQNTLTFDQTPTAGSTNPVTSGGVKTALDDKADKTAIETPTSAASYEVVANKQYRLGTLAGNTTITLASYAGADLAVYDFVFTTPATAPTITWPAGITWAGGNAPTINASKTYEVNIVNNLAVIVEF